MIKSLIFDFDGLILDTETPEAEAWQAIYSEQGVEFPLERWGEIIGGYGISDFDAARHLVEITGIPKSLESLRERHRHASDERLNRLSVLSGAFELFDRAAQLRLTLAIASSSPHDWVDMHLRRLGLWERFAHVVCADDVAAGRTKPNPDLFLLALAKLDHSASEAIVFEDSPNGVRAGRAAGIYVVMVPNPVTAMLNTNEADITLSSLSEVDLPYLLERL